MQQSSCPQTRGPSKRATRTRHQSESSGRSRKVMHEIVVTTVIDEGIDKLRAYFVPPTGRGHARRTDRGDQGAACACGLNAVDRMQTETAVPQTETRYVLRSLSWTTRRDSSTGRERWRNMTCMRGSVSTARQVGPCPTHRLGFQGPRLAQVMYRWQRDDSDACFATDGR